MLPVAKLATNVMTGVVKLAPNVGLVATQVPSLTTTVAKLSPERGAMDNSRSLMMMEMFCHTMVISST
jgi:hypothetical protein